MIYRHDNMPHPRWKGVSTFPQHSHQGKPEFVVKSYLPAESPEDALRAFLTFARQILNWSLAILENVQKSPKRKIRQSPVLNMKGKAE